MNALEVVPRTLVDNKIKSSVVCGRLRAEVCYHPWQEMLTYASPARGVCKLFTLIAGETPRNSAI